MGDGYYCCNPPSSHVRGSFNPSLEQRFDTALISGLLKSNTTRTPATDPGSPPLALNPEIGTPNGDEQGPRRGEIAEGQAKMRNPTYTGVTTSTCTTLVDWVVAYITEHRASDEGDAAPTGESANRVTLFQCPSTCQGAPRTECISAGCRSAPTQVVHSTADLHAQWPTFTPG